jgi:probable rRNA maturation factor
MNESASQGFPRRQSFSKVHVAIINRQRVVPIDADKVAKLVKAVVALEGRPCSEVGVHFIGAAAMRRLHGQFFNDSSLTDCISFPLEAELLGDVFVCPQVAMTYARHHKGDPYREISLYIVHGLLHLMGYDDIREKNCREMRAAEERHMRHLQKRRLLLAPFKP